MTTIAWDGKTLAADRRISFGGVSEAEISKIARRKDGALCGAAGSTALCAGFRRWFLKGGKGNPPPLVKEGEEASAIVIHKSGKTILYEKAGWYEIETTKYANGSGWELALGAMHAGCTAEEAVRIAAKLDGNTGSEVDVLHHGIN